MTTAAWPLSERLEGCASQQAIIVLCSDISEVGPHAIPAGVISAGLARRSVGTRVFVVDRLCSDPALFSTTLQSRGICRVVIGCRQISTTQDEIRSHLRRVGILPAGAQLVDLMPSEQSIPTVAGEQSIALLRSALARVVQADLSTPVHEHPASGSVEFPRRSLLHAGTLARRPIAVGAW
jgi:hypothetical protein